MIVVPAEHLRIVVDATWAAIQERFRRHRHHGAAAPPMISGRGVRRQYLLSGFGRCARCGGSMQIVSRASGSARTFRYVCSTYWNRGAGACSNGLMARMEAADTAVRDTLAREVLCGSVVGRALDIAVAAAEHEHDGRTSHDDIKRRLATVEPELRNLAAVAAHGGAVPTVLELLSKNDAERRQLESALKSNRRRDASGSSRRALRAELQSHLDTWERLLASNAIEARAVLDGALADRIQFEPNTERRRYRLTLPIAFDRVLVAAIPALKGFQETLASPTGHSIPWYSPVAGWMARVV